MAFTIYFYVLGMCYLLIVLKHIQIDAEVNRHTCFELCQKFEVFLNDTIGFPTSFQWLRKKLKYCEKRSEICTRNIYCLPIYIIVCLLDPGLLNDIFLVLSTNCGSKFIVTFPIKIDFSCPWISAGTLISWPIRYSEIKLCSFHLQSLARLTACISPLLGSSQSSATRLWVQATWRGMCRSIQQPQYSSQMTSGINQFSVWIILNVSAQLHFQLVLAPADIKWSRRTTELNPRTLVRL